MTRKARQSYSCAKRWAPRTWPKRWQQLPRQGRGPTTERCLTSTLWPLSFFGVFVEGPSLHDVLHAER